MPRHHGGGVTNLSGVVDGLPKQVGVKGRSAQKRGPVGTPSTGKGSPSNPAAAAREGADQARKPRS